MTTRKPLNQRPPRGSAPAPASGAWGGRFARGAAAEAQAYTASIATDIALYRQDLAGSRAHARMLAKQRIIPRTDAAAILRGLDQIEKEIAGGRLAQQAELEDIHLHIEARLAALIGEEAAGRLHTGRSRNDQVALDTRLYVREAIDETLPALRGLQGALIDLAGRHQKVYLPGYTHLQRAQPVLLAHHLLAYVEMLERDHARFAEARARANVLPLGSAALAGAAYPLDREMVAKELGFAAISRNSLDAVSDRDYIVEYVAAAAIAMTHVSRLCEDLILWSSAEFGYLAFDDAYATGSSIMPQKKNPDIAELARGKTGRVVGHLMALLTTLKGLPLAYNRDLQEDKAPLLDSVETLLSSLRVLAGAIETVRIDGARARAAVDHDPFILATDYADSLARKGVPFRTAHRAVGELVRRCEKEGRALASLSLAELRAAHLQFGPDAVGLTVERALAARDVPGGTAPRRVSAALRAARRRVESGSREGGA